MRKRRLIACAAALGTSACCCDSGLDGLTVITDDRTLASVSQDAGLSLAAGVAPGMEGGFFYDWPRRDYEQQLQDIQRRERAIERQARALP